MLPAKVRMLAKKLFARQSGFGKREIVEFFSGYSNDIPEYPWTPDLDYRTEYFDACLAYLPVDVQREALTDLCRFEGAMRYGTPAAAGVTQLTNWLREGSGALHQPDKSSIVDWPYVKRQWDKALSEVDADPESAISSARTLLETVCKHILDERGITYKEADGDLPALYKLTVNAVDLSENTKASACLKQMSSGAFSTVNGIAGLRNEQGDSHGKGKQYVGPDPRHARFAVNTVGALATFLIETHQASTSTPQKVGSR